VLTCLFVINIYFVLKTVDVLTTEIDEGVKSRADHLDFYW